MIRRRHLLQVSNFNPRLHAGGDPARIYQIFHFCIISIHASTQEATAVLAKYKPAFLAKINNFFLFCCTLSTQKRHAFPSFLIFVQLDQCESLRGFLSTLDSHWSLFALRNISQAYVLLRFCKTAIHRINVSSAGIPLSTPICSTLVWYLFPR